MKNIKINTKGGEKTEAIIFDLGGVLLNLNFSRSIEAFTRLGFKNVQQELSKLLHAHPTPGNENIFHLYEKGLIDSSRFRDGLRRMAGNDIADSDIDMAWTAMLLDIHPENASILEKLKDSYRLFLLSNTNAIHIETLLKARKNGVLFSDLVRLFRKVYYSHEVNMRKPDKEIFEHVIRDAGLKAENSLFIDDSIPNIEAAGETGLQVYHHQAGTSLAAVFEIT